ncbi:MAG: hypothetical protein ACERLG_08625, partial [Sedimentibacter sp.]
MIEKVLKYNKNRKGSALVWMILTFTITIILMNSIIYLTRQDLKETIMQEERLQTYYIAAAGIDLTYAALMDPDYDPKKIEKAISKIGDSSKKLTDTINIVYDSEKKGTATVSINRVTIDEEKWLQIVSVGKLEDKSTEVTTT